MDHIKISIDAMGGDFGPDVTVPAAFIALAKNPELELVLVGDNKILQTSVDTLVSKNHKYISLKDRIIIHHASEVVAMDESPSKALRTKKDSSMRVAINLVKDNVTKACVSAGNTGALMATAHFVLKTLPGIDRPAIIASLPTHNVNKEVRVLDLGANVDSESYHLYQFAIMGFALTKAIDKIANPKIGLLNIGEEEIKGNEQVKQTAKLLAENKNINYIGYIEGDDIFKGDVDVVVCDGFIGNIALKTIEGLAKLIAFYVKKAFTANVFSKIIAIIAKPVLKKLANYIDPGKRNGATLIGLNGIVVKSHGGAKIPAFANAINEAILQVEQNVPQRISEEIALQLIKS